MSLWKNNNISKLVGKEWATHFECEFSLDYMIDLELFLESEEKQKCVIYPQKNEYFKAFTATPLSNVKVVILGQDPYINPEEAHGLSFSVPDGVKIPPSLRNIYKELTTDYQGFNSPKHGCLEKWSSEGVLLLNSILTIGEKNKETKKPKSHSGRGWEKFTDRAIEIINYELSNVVFLLWGSYAQKKASFVDTKKHCVLKSVHPSPLSAYRGFLGCKHFSKTNNYLIKNNKKPIDWSL